MDESTILIVRQKLAESIEEFRKDLDTWVTYGYPAEISKTLSSTLSRLQRGNPISEEHLENVTNRVYGSEFETLNENAVDLAERFIATLQKISIFQQQLRAQEASPPPPPPPESDEPGLSDIPAEIARTVTFIDGLISELAKANAIQPNLQRWYAYFRREATTLSSVPHVGVFQNLMQELQETMERILFRQTNTNPRIQLDLTVLWTQLIYLYNQVTVLSKLAQTEGPPRVPLEEGGGEAPPPPPPPSEGGGAPPPPPPSGGGSPPVVRPPSPTRGGDFKAQIAAGKTLRKASERVLRETEEQRKDREAQEKLDRLKQVMGGEPPPKSGFTEEEWEEGGLSEADLKRKYAETGPPETKQAAVFSQLRARITRRMEAQLIGHPLFSAQSTNINNPLIIQLRMPTNKK